MVLRHVREGTLCIHQAVTFHGHLYKLGPGDILFRGEFSSLPAAGNAQGVHPANGFRKPLGGLHIRKVDGVVEVLIAQQVAEQHGGLGPEQAALGIEYLVGDAVYIGLMLVGVQKGADAALHKSGKCSILLNYSLQGINRLSDPIEPVRPLEPAGHHIALPGVFLRDVRDALGLCAGEQSLGHCAEIAEVKGNCNVPALRRLGGLVRGEPGIGGGLCFAGNGCVIDIGIRLRFLRCFSGGPVHIGGSGQAQAAGNEQAAEQKGQHQAGFF